MSIKKVDDIGERNEDKSGNKNTVSVTPESMDKNMTDNDPNQDKNDQRCLICTDSHKSENKNKKEEILK